MDWEACVICGDGGGDLRCPANSKQGNGLEIYSQFLERVAKFQDLQELPVSIKFSEEHDADIFLKSHAKWHKSCHLKFASSKLIRLQAKRQLDCESTSDHQEQRKSKRQRLSGSFDQRGCIFCSEVSGTLHNCSTMELDHDIRRMATELQDTELLAKISAGDLVAIEAKYHFNCLSAFKSRYRSAQRSMRSCATSQEDRLIEVETFARLVSYIEERIVSGIFVFKLSELHRVYTDLLQEYGVSMDVHKTRLKMKVLDHFIGNCQEQLCDGKSITLVFNQGLKDMLKEAVDFRDFEAEALTMMKLVKVLRKEMMEWKSFDFTGSFSHDCQTSAVPSTLKLFFSLLLNGSSTRSKHSHDTQASLTIAQLVYFNTKFNTSSASLRHSKAREPPLPVFVGLHTHTLVRSRKMVDTLYKLGISISYDRVLQIENSLATAVCDRFKKDDLVCPANLRNGLVTVGALDNIDYNPSATTAQGSFHGTSISVFQIPRHDFTGIVRDPIVIDGAPLKEFSLPEEYTNVPAVSCKTDKLSVSQLAFDDKPASLLEIAKIEEEKWVQHSIQLLTKNTLVKDDYLSWAAFHASLDTNAMDYPAIIALLPLFHEKAATLSMVKHGMDVLKSITSHLNPEQIPIMAFDQPLFALAKFVQWSWPESYGEEHLIAMFGGLHIEMALWNTLGDLLEGSGWTSALCEADVASSGIADSFLKASHLTKTRHAHQVTALALAKLQEEAWEYHCTFSHCDIPFETWKKKMISTCPTFQFWNIILKFEIQVLIFVRAHRQKNFDLFIEALEALTPWFFVLDHSNYARWIPIHLRDMKALSGQAKEQLKGSWVIPKSQKKYSCMPIDQAHEQNNELVKGSGGAVGLTENPSAFRRWMVAGPEQARIINEFESQFLKSEKSNHLQHEQSHSAQILFQKQVNNLIEVISTMGNPFKEDSDELIILDTRNCADDAVVSTIKTIEKLGSTQYQQYVVNVIKNHSTSIHSPIKRNSLPLLKRPLPKGPKRLKQQVDSLKNDCNLFSHLYIASQFRDSNLDNFFSHENQPWPPSLSEHGKLRLPAKKSDLLLCIGKATHCEPPNLYDVKIVDGPAIVHSLSANCKHVKTFDEYGDRVFLDWIEKALHNSNRVDVIWDQYMPNSLKDSTREKRGKGVRKKVSGPTKLPSNFQDFLRDSKNKEELFNFLSIKVSKSDRLTGKNVYITSGQDVMCRVPYMPMPSCNLEEADSRICVHIKDAVEKGARKVCVRTVDTDVIIIIAGIFFELQDLYPNVEIWVAFGMGKNFQFYYLNDVCQSLGKDKCRALPFFHSFTGCDTTSQFLGKGKKSSWDAWKAYPSATAAFQYVFQNPFVKVNKNSMCFEAIERFTCVLYDKTTSITSVNDLRQDLFSKRAKLINSIPPTQGALIEHTNRALYQASIWATCLKTHQIIPPPEGFGWTQEKGWKPVWTLLPEVASACQELLKCGCKTLPLCSKKCKCRDAGLQCTPLCHCGGLCDH